MVVNQYLGLAFVFLISGANAAEKPPAWDKAPQLPVETEYLRDRIDAPQNHFLLNGQEGFVSGREFYQVIGEGLPFLWVTHPFLRYGTDRTWQGDSSIISYRAMGTNEVGEQAVGYGFVDAAWSPVEGLRLHTGLEQNELYASRTLPARRTFVGPAADDKLAAYGENLPLKSQVKLGASYRRFGQTMAGQYNQGYWWTTSPVSGQVYGWEGFNADLSFRAGQDFELSLVEQNWEAPGPYEFYNSNYRRSEMMLSFRGSSAGAWLWRLDAGYQRRAMLSKGAFKEFSENTYPFRFRYRQEWSAPDSLPFRMVSQGSVGLRDKMFSVQHSTEFKEDFGTHQPMQFVRGYFRHTMKNYFAPTEYFTPDTVFLAKSRAGSNARGFVAGSEYREVRKHFLVGFGGNYAMEWEVPIFNLQSLDTVVNLLRRQGELRGSNAYLQNATGKIFASGGAFGERATWRAQGGIREFWGPDAKAVEYQPSPWWAGGGAGWTFQTKTQIDAQATYLGPKLVRGWGTDFKIPSHWESHVALTHPLFSEGLKISLAGFNAFGKDIQEHPNGNPVRFRITAALEGTIY